MRKITNKKGSHVEIVISFAIFVTFLVFLYSVLEPAVRKPKSKEYILESSQTAILDYITEEVMVYNLEINNDEPDAQGGGCFEISNVNVRMNATVKSNENIVNSILYYDYDVDFDTLSITYYSDRYTIYLSKEFTRGGYTECSTELPECSGIPDERCYHLTKIRTEEHIFKTKIEKMEEEYEDSSKKSVLMRNIGIPSETNFYFKLTDSSDERNVIIGGEEPEIEGNVNVYVEEFPINYIDEENDPENKQTGFLIVKIW